MERIGFKPLYVHSEPQKVYLELTNSCNLNCTICYRQSWQQETGEIDPAVLDRLIDELKTYKSPPEIVLGGIGEPLFYRDFAGVASRLQDFPLTLTSNGTLLHNREIASSLRGFKRVVVSIDGVDETYQKIRGASLADVIRGIELVKSTGKRPEIFFQLVLSEENRNSVLGVIDLAADLAVHGIVISNLLPQTQDYCGKILYSRTENTEMRQFYNRVLNHSLLRGVNLTIPAYELKTDRTCRYIDGGSTVVNFRGDVAPCYRLAHNGQEYVFGRPKEVIRHSFGNLEESTLLEIWNQGDYQRFRYEVHSNRYPSCPDCELVDGCEIVNSTTWDCQGHMPTCGDCLWARNFVICP